MNFLDVKMKDWFQVHDMGMVWTSLGNKKHVTCAIERLNLRNIVYIVAQSIMRSEKDIIVSLEKDLNFYGWWWV